MKNYVQFVVVLCTLCFSIGGYAQRPIGGDALILDNNAGKQITIVAPAGLPNSYTWTLPLYPPPANSAFSEAGSLTGQMLRWDNSLGYWVATSALFAGGNTAGSFVGIGTTTPARLLDIAGISGTPNVRVQSLGGTTNWGATIANTDGIVFANNSGDLVKRDPMSVLNQFSWLIGGNTNPSSSILGTNTNHGLDIRTNGTRRMLLAANGDIALGNASSPSTLTIEPGEGGNVIVNNIISDNSASQFLTVDDSKRVRMRSLSSILAVTANEGLVYDSPNIKLGATNGTTNPLVVNRFVNLNTNTLAFTNNNGSSSLLILQGSSDHVGIGTATPNSFKLEVAGHVGPAVNNTYDLGSNSLRWRDIYVGPSSLHIGTGSGDQTTLSYSNVSGVKKFNIDPDDDGDIQFNIDGTGNLEFTGAFEPNNAAGTSGQYLKSSGANTPPTWASITTSAWGISGNSGTDSLVNFVGTTDDRDLVFRTNNITRARFRNSTFDDDSGAFEPYTDNAYTLGTPTHRWRDLYMGPSSIKMGGFISGNKSGQSEQAVDEVTISYSNGTLIIDKPLGSTGSMVPNNSDIYTLGTNTSRWRDLYLGPSSLHIGDDTLEAKISYEPTVAELRINTNGVGPTEVTMFGNGNVAIANLAAGGLVKAAAGTGILSVASGGSDFESPLTFNNGLTRTTNTIKLGGALTALTDVPLAGSNLTFSGLGRVGIGTLTPASKFAVGAASQFQVDSFGTIAAATGITSSGTIQFSSLASGIVKSTSGVLGIATAGTDYESALTFNNGLTRTTNTIKLGGTLTAATDIPLGGFNLTFSGTGNIGIGDASPASLLTVGSGDLFQVDATGDLIKIKNVAYAWPAANASGVLSNNGSGVLSWASALLSLNGQTGTSQTFATSTTGTDFTISSTSNIHTFNLPNASGTARGLVSTGTQTFEGLKTFDDSATFTSGFAIANQKGITLNELTANGTDGVTLRSPAACSTAYTLTLPADDGTANQVLVTDGSGILSWATPAGSAAAGNSTEVQYNNSGALAGSANFTYNGTTMTVLSTGNAVSDSSSSTTDEQFAIRGTVTGSTTNQTVGIWGDAPNTTATNTGTIGVLATGNGNTGITATNIAAQINDGELTSGRTTETTGLNCSIGGSSIALAEAATGGSAYSAQGPSGVVEITSISVAVSNAQVEDAGRLTIPNRYVNASSIILVTVFDATASAGANEFSFSTQVRGRDDDSFDVSVNVIKNGAAVRTLTGYKLGYMILNPSR
jgi:hypothetical protein